MLSLFASTLSFNAPATALTNSNMRAHVSMRSGHDALADFGKLPASIDQGVSGAIPMMVGGVGDRLPRGKGTGVPEPNRASWKSDFFEPSTVGVRGQSLGSAHAINEVVDPSATSVYAIGAGAAVPALEGAAGKVVPTGNPGAVKPLESDFVYVRGAMRGNGKA